MGVVVEAAFSYRQHMRAAEKSSPLPSHLQQSVLVIIELARGHRLKRNLERNFCSGGISMTVIEVPPKYNKIHCPQMR